VLGIGEHFTTIRRHGCESCTVAVNKQAVNGRRNMNRKFQKFMTCVNESRNWSNLDLKTPTNIRRVLQAVQV